MVCFGKQNYYVSELNGGEPEDFNINGGTGSTPGKGMWTLGIGGSDTLDDREHDYDEGRLQICSGATYELMREVFDAGEEGIEALKTAMNETGGYHFHHLKMEENVFTTRMKDMSTFLMSETSRRNYKRDQAKYDENLVIKRSTYIDVYFIGDDGKIKCRCGSDHPGQMFEHLHNHGYWELIPCLLCYKGDISELKGTGKAIYKKSILLGEVECLACKGIGRVTEKLTKTGKTVLMPCVTCCKEFRELKGTGRMDP